MTLNDGTYLICPKCSSEDASETSEAKALAEDIIKCPFCGEEYKAVYDATYDRFIVKPRDWTR